MRYFIGSELGWIAVPFLFVVGAAYVWVMDRLLRNKADKGASVVSTPAATTITRAA